VSHEGRDTSQQGAIRVLLECCCGDQQIKVNPNTLWYGAKRKSAIIESSQTPPWLQ